MINENFIILAVILSVFGPLKYAIATIKGEAQPNRVTWLMWGLAPLVAFAAELDKGVGIQSLGTFIVGFNPMLIFIASFFNKKSVWKLTTLDYVMGALSFLGIVLWLITKDGNYAIFFAIMADFLAGVPTIIKSYWYPETENFWPFATGCLTSGTTLLTIKTWTFPQYGFPMYIFICCLLLILLIKFRLGKTIQKN